MNFVGLKIIITWLCNLCFNSCPCYIVNYYNYNSVWPYNYNSVWPCKYNSVWLYNYNSVWHYNYNFVWLTIINLYDLTSTILYDLIITILYDCTITIWYDLTITIRYDLTNTIPYDLIIINNSEWPYNIVIHMYQIAYKTLRCHIFVDSWFPAITNLVSQRNLQGVDWLAQTGGCVSESWRCLVW